MKFPEASLWKKMGRSVSLSSIDMEITWRCNNNCRHCCLNLAPEDKTAQKTELTLAQIKKIADAAVDLGVLWFLITGGEPLLRPDFPEIYRYLKKKGLLVSVFTNATLINQKHIKLFKAYPPRDIEVSVYGVTSSTYTAVSRNPTSFARFKKGLSLLLDNQIKVRLKAMAMRSNFHEMRQITNFCRKYTYDYFRFDPFLQLHFNRDSVKNRLIESERLNANEIIFLEENDKQRLGTMKDAKECLIDPGAKELNDDHIFHCGAGKGNVNISYDGFVRPCFSLVHPDYRFNIKKYSLEHIYKELFPIVLNRRSSRKEFISKCLKCEIVNLCRWCPGESYLESGELDLPIKYLCEIAHMRRKLLEK
jgi:radical SAM protein with 4Fe4S-binding SPASM domain